MLKKNVVLLICRKQTNT